MVNASDERLDFIEREIVRRIGDRLYGLGDAMTKWTIDDVAARFEGPQAPVDACLLFECRATSNCWPAIVRSEWETFAADERCTDPFRRVQTRLNECWRRCAGCSGSQLSNVISYGCARSLWLAGHHDPLCLRPHDGMAALAAGIADGRRSTQWCGGRVGF